MQNQNQQNNNQQQGGYQNQQQNNQQQQGGYQQNQPKQPVAKGLVQVPVGTFASKTEFEQDGRTPKQKTEFLPMGRFTDWGTHVSVEVVLDGKKVQMMLFRDQN